ncbi:sodium channel modifier 1-like [Argonauta hians]
MSFKRDGDDYNLLKSQRQSRVNELFAENIPDEEVQILSNGKLSCTVCHYHPVFDTLYILLNHRQGRRHQENAERKSIKEKELQELIKKHNQKQFLATGGMVPEKCVSKVQLTPYDRKPTIVLTEKPSADTIQPSSTNTDSSKPKPPSIRAAEQEKNAPLPLKPYTKKQNLSEKHPKSPFPKLSQVYGPVQIKGEGQRSSEKAQSKFLEDRKTEWDQFSCQIPRKRKVLANSREKTDSQSSMKVPRSVTDHTTASETEDHPKVVEKEELAKKYWQISGSGWKKDWVGNWIKDEDAEFDSDEEPPDLP